MEKSCLNCVNCVCVDFGYSNWTVEGTDVYCVKEKHPDACFDRWYGEDARLKYANQCDAYTKGSHEHLDVDGEGWDDLPQEHKDYLNRR